MDFKRESKIQRVLLFLFESLIQEMITRKGKSLSLLLSQRPFCHSDIKKEKQKQKQKQKNKS